MAAIAWSVAVPASLYITRSVGTTVSQSLLRNPAPEPLDDTIDTAGALASADAALRLVPVSPTANHLRELVSTSAHRLRELIESAQSRLRRRTFSRLFRNPCFREENSRLRAEAENLKSRVHLFLAVVSIKPSVGKTASGPTSAFDIDTEEVQTEEMRDACLAREYARTRRDEETRVSLIHRAFARSIPSDGEMRRSEEESGSSDDCDSDS